MRKGPVVLLSAGLASVLGLLLGPRLLPAPRQARRHPMLYYLALPHGWSPAHTWPILVVVDGANHGHFLWNFLRFRKARHALPFILVAPLVVTNTGHPDPQASPYSPAVWTRIAQEGAAQFDATGVLAIVDEVRQTYHGQDKFFLTGWSAGGHLAWQLIFTHPDRLAGAVLAAANFAGRGVTQVSQAPGRTTLPITVLQGDHDPLQPALTEQWERAYHLAASHGYTKVVREHIAGAGHSPFPAQVFATLAPLVADR